MTVALAAALIVTGCSSNGDGDDGDLGVRPIDEGDQPEDDAVSDDGAPEPDDDGSDTEPEPEPDPDSFAIPDEIDEAYVDLVMNELLAVDSAILRDVLSRNVADDLEDDDYERIRAIFSGPQLISNGEDYLTYGTDADSRQVFLPVDELGEIRWATRRIMEADDGCIVAIGYYDLTEVSVAPYEDDEFSLASLTRAPEDGDDARSHNRTPWRLHDVNLVQAGGEPVPEEDWDRINYRAVLDSTCAEADE